MGYPIEPKGIITLCKCPLESDYKNILSFNNKQKQTEYFENLKGNKLYSNYNYIKKEGVINLEVGADEIMDYNYLFYKNVGYTDKTYYCFIKNIRFLNAENCEISIETDVTQTYQFDVNFNESFVEREHTNDDSVGNNTQPENLETGDYIINGHIKDDTMFKSGLCYVVMSTLEETKTLGDDKLKMTGGGIYNGIYNGATYYRFDTIPELKKYFAELSENGQIDGIVGIFMAPKYLVKFKNPSDKLDHEVISSDSVVSYSVTILVQQFLDNTYNPRNKKLLTYPYNYLLVSNNNGSDAIFHYENFKYKINQSKDPIVNFKVNAAITPGMSIRILPVDYLRDSEDNQAGINLGKLPICGWQCDMYTNWLTQNSINIPGIGTITSDNINAVNSVINAGAGFATGNLAGVASGISGISNALISKKQHELMPPQARGNLNCGDVITSSDNNTFHFYRMSIKEEFAKIIDKYFDMYGYATNLVKAPNIFGRRNWNYVKTLECNFTGEIPQSDLRIIKEIFNNGTTIWHNPQTIYDYSQNNDII